MYFTHNGMYGNIISSIQPFLFSTVSHIIVNRKAEQTNLWKVLPLQSLFTGYPLVTSDAVSVRHWAACGHTIGVQHQEYCKELRYGGSVGTKQGLQGSGVDMS